MNRDDDVKLNHKYRWCNEPDIYVCHRLDWPMAHFYCAETGKAFHTDVTGNYDKLDEVADESVHAQNYRHAFGQMEQRLCDAFGKK